MSKIRIRWNDITKAMQAVKSGTNITNIVKYVCLSSGKEIAVLHDTNLVYAHGMLCACTMKNRFGYDIIVVDGVFMTFNENVQNALIHHELAHIEMKHSENINKVKYMLTNLFTVPKIEYEADEYAAKIVGLDNMVDALKCLMDTYYLNDYVIKKRIKYLEKSI